MKKSLMVFFCWIAFFGIALSVPDVYSATKYEVEPNENKTSSTPIAFGDAVVGKMWHALDYDWYAVTVSSAGVFNISAYYKFPEGGTADEGVLLVELRNTSNMVLSELFVDYKELDYAYSQNVNIPSAGTYYIVAHCPSQAKFKRESYYLTISQGESSNNTGSLIDRVKDISLSLSQNSVKSDNSDQSIITATVVDENRVPIKGIKVTFAITAGQISAASAVTDDNGKAVVSFSSGHFEKGNQTVRVTAYVPDKMSAVLTKTVPIKIAGSTLVLDPGKYTNLEIGENDTTTLTITAKDSGGNPISDADIRVNQVKQGSESDIVQIIMPSTNKTDFNGELKLDIKGINVGNATIKVDGVGDTKELTYSVYKAGNALRITSTEPADDPVPANKDGNVDLNINDILTIDVNIPNTTTTIRLVSTLSSGLFSSDSNLTEASNVLELPVTTEIKKVYFKSSAAGFATIYVIDKNNQNQTDSINVTIAASPEDADQISLQASPSIVNPSVGETSNFSDLTVTVRTKENQPVANAIVLFSIMNSGGGGERVNPGWQKTDSSGVARTKFYSGKISSGGKGITVMARVRKDDNTTITDSVNIIIGGTPGSIAIGSSTTISSDGTNTHYILPMSVLVADAGGHPVANQTVSLNSWSFQYYKGVWAEIMGIDKDGNLIPSGKWKAEYTSDSPFPNEDINRNNILDTNEDTNENCQITPINSSSGNIPQTVITNEDGVAKFDLIYLKHYAGWIDAEIQASTVVSGTETKSELIFILPWVKGEEKILPSSPFNADKNCLAESIEIGYFDDENVFHPGELKSSLKTEEKLAIGGTATITAVLAYLDEATKKYIKYKKNTEITFTTECATAVINDVLTSEGEAITTYRADGCTGSNDTVTGTADIAGKLLTASIKIPLTEIPVGSIEFVSATPNHIALAGTSNSILPSSSVVKFLVKDTMGNPKPGQDVNFAPTTTVGGLKITPLTAKTDSNGFVQVTVSSGSVATHVRVKATITVSGTTITTVSDNLVISTGLPDQDSFSLSADIYNPEAWDYDGAPVNLTIRASDHFNNPVPDGTAVYFATEGGVVDPTCSTVNGVCSVQWRSQNPRPTPTPTKNDDGKEEEVDGGRATVTAFTIGEESFIDRNGTGRFETGIDSFTDMPEAFLDKNKKDNDDKTQTRDPDEEFLDFNGNKTYDPINSKYNGTLCNDKDTTCTSELIAVFDDIVISMSGSNANIAFSDKDGKPLTEITLGDAVKVNFTLSDSNNNSIPNGSTVTIIPPTGTTIQGNSSFIVTNTITPNVFSFGISKISGATTGTGILTVSVKTPKEVESSKFVSVTIQ